MDGDGKRTLFLSFIYLSPLVDKRQYKAQVVCSSSRERMMKEARRRIRDKEAREGCMVEC